MQLNPHSFNAAGLNEGIQARVHEVASRNFQIGDTLNDLGLMEEVGERAPVRPGNIANGASAGAAGILNGGEF
jgi:phosphoserine phosphatase